MTEATSENIHSYDFKSSFLNSKSISSNILSFNESLDLNQSLKESTTDNSFNSILSLQNQKTEKTNMKENEFISEIEKIPDKILLKMIERRFSQTNNNISENQASNYKKRREVIQKLQRIISDKSIDHKIYFKTIAFFDMACYYHPEIDHDSYSKLITIFLIICLKHAGNNTKLQNILSNLDNNSELEYFGTNLENAEMEALNLIDWNLEFVSAFDFLEFFTGNNYFCKEDIISNYKKKYIDSKNVEQFINDALFKILEYCIIGKIKR